MKGKMPSKSKMPPKGMPPKDMPMKDKMPPEGMPMMKGKMPMKKKAMMMADMPEAMATTAPMQKSKRKR